MPHNPYSTNKFAVAAVAVIATILGWLHPAQAQIVYTQVNVQIYRNTYNLDVNNDGVADFAIVSGDYKICDCNSRCRHLEYLKEYPTIYGNGVVGSPPAPLKLGHEIGPKQHFYGGYGFFSYDTVSCSGQRLHYGLWRGKTAYLGFTFQINGETHYGWAELTDDGFEGVLTGYAYEATPGKALTAGQTQ